MAMKTASMGSLIITVILLVTGLSAAHAQPDEARLASYRLSMPVLKKMDAAIANLADVMQSDAGLLTEEDREDAESISDIADLYRSRPALRRAIEEAGLSVDEFALCLMSWLQAGMASAMLQNASPAERDRMIERSGAPLENVRFFEANADYMRALGSRVQQLSE
ncbi:hypothetical protein [Isoalcanivorax pacificus]|nr:hypothetical protein [Isoalcanivorax pacificus]